MRALGRAVLFAVTAIGCAQALQPVRGSGGSGGGGSGGGFALLLPLAITSTAGWVRRLGFVRWQRLHRLIYFAALAGVIHYCWLVKSDERLPLMYGAILAVLMAYRFYIWKQTAGPRTATTPRTASLPG